MTDNADQIKTIPPEESQKKDFKRYLYPTLGVAAIALVWGLSQASRNNNNSSDRKEVTLSPEQRQALDTEVAQSEEQIKNLPANASVEDHFKLHVKLASAKYNLGLYEEAIAILDKVRDENQDNPSMWQRYALIYRDMGDAVKAKDSAKRAWELDKTTPAYWLTYIELSADESAEAIKKLYQDALQATENNVGIVTAYAQFLEKIGDKQGAIEQWRKAAEIFPQGKADYDAEIARLQK